MERTTSYRGEAERTSERHADILNGYKAGGSRFNEWAREKLGDLVLRDWAWGRVSLRWDIDDRFIMPDGVMFGGHIASVCDHVAGLAAMTVLADNEERFRTTRLETNFFRPVRAPFVEIEARVANASKNLIFVEADLFNAEDKLAVKAFASQMRRRAGTP